ncbi:zinc finger c-x8-c-x5-c-x3-h type domain containing protein [Entamoeba histolytica HM-1:IMSS-B]|uniref:C3H1-type domain-containing protein n=5 Tax=Entamoeba histolytica TaxID=5759 RepID=A0A175JFD0_ENTHI|nr:zinc finger Cx8-C-x5-C-x3-H type (and similar) domain containing protein [Entamoeba histolytica KU27]EMH74774.1 zinc finger c-x8-c-x5-c-x3-h type domain containing protein [Entamoeba histolytica HM-1:IMSS-B]EMS14446.1 zinc finger c-x8-c-x5-c-x3-h type (and similar) domain containing protein [Entamoeba histolytica HM-3:IMSS]ENY61337.1 zinc finger domain containing protein [Entamoeba histolytica HM-1:IMSS-A]GAT92163.1 hypothetical protein CL6EHI_c00024 [Entamoeba histolytica]
MNKFEFVDLSTFSNDSSMFEVFSSQDTSTMNSFAMDELDAIPTEEEKSYFESLQKLDPSFNMDKMLDDDDDNDNEANEQFPTPTPYVLSTTRPQSNPNPIASQILSHSLENQLILEYSHQDKYPNKWRTQPCLFFQRYGFCRKGDECNFSHEIPISGKQFVSVDKLFRTKPCKYFFTTGTCRKGENCNYSHDTSKFKDYKFD